MRLTGVSKRFYRYEHRTTSLREFFIRTVLRDSGESMDPKSWDQIGVIARVTSSIRAEGVGEIVYEQHGMRQVASARSATATAIPRSTEVVILRVERGVAIVEPFEDLLGNRTPTTARR